MFVNVSFPTEGEKSKQTIRMEAESYSVSTGELRQLVSSKKKSLNQRYSFFY